MRGEINAIVNQKEQELSGYGPLQGVITVVIKGFY
jgi:hypothetical protein